AKIRVSAAERAAKDVVSSHEELARLDGALQHLSVRQEALKTELTRLEATVAAVESELANLRARLRDRSVPDPDGVPVLVDRLRAMTRSLEELRASYARAWSAHERYRSAEAELDAAVAAAGFPDLPTARAAHRTESALAALEDS